MSDTSNFYGQDGTTSSNSDYHAINFLIRQELGKLHFMMPVKIVAVNGGGLAGPPTVDVQPLINQIDGVGKSTPHGTVYGIPAHRAQGGGNAIINDPKVGDLGSISVAARDISAVVKSMGQANPGSRRRSSLSDSMYHGGVWASPTQPTQYVIFTDHGVEIHDKNGNSIVTNGGTMTLTATTINLVGTVHLGSTGGVPAAQQGTVDTAGNADMTNLATKVFVT